MRSFTTTGPVEPDKHYCIPPLERFDRAEVLRLVDGEEYFVLHAPRQTGKTSALLALRDRLNEQGYACVYTTVETARTAREDVGEAMRAVHGRLASRARSTLGDGFLARNRSRILAEFGPNEALGERRWPCSASTPRRRDSRSRTGRARRSGPGPGGPAVAGERAGLGDLLQAQGRAGPLARHHRR